MNRRTSILAMGGLLFGAARSARGAVPSAVQSAIRNPQSAIRPRFWRATIHHTGTPPANPAARVRSIDAFHRSRKWDGIGYHLLVAEDGAVYFGRPLDKQGAHVLHENEGNLGIALIGTYTDRPPPEAALASVRRLLAWAFETWGFGPEAVYFHKDLAVTECPGAWSKELLLAPMRSADCGVRNERKEAKG